LAHVGNKVSRGHAGYLGRVDPKVSEACGEPRAQLVLRVRLACLGQEDHLVPLVRREIKVQKDHRAPSAHLEKEVSLVLRESLVPLGTKEREGNKGFLGNQDHQEWGARWAPWVHKDAQVNQVHKERVGNQARMDFRVRRDLLVHLGRQALQDEQAHLENKASVAHMACKDPKDLEVPQALQGSQVKLALEV